MLNLGNIAYVVGIVLLVMLSTSIHEFSHAYAAHLLGDDTAKEHGRLTLNPLAHLDPVGSFLLPLIMALGNGPVFAYANPVPYNPRRLRNPGRDDALVALAGPLSNVAQALVGAAIVRIMELAHVQYVMNGDVVYALALYTYVNLTLATRARPTTVCSATRWPSCWWSSTGCRAFWASTSWDSSSTTRPGRSTASCWGSRCPTACAQTPLPGPSTCS